MIPTLVSGSRFPVGSSQIRSGGWFTNARAIETRCCSPPESSSGSDDILCASPTRFSTSGTLRRIEFAFSPCTLSAYATFSAAVRFGSSLKSWKAQPRHLRALQPPEVTPADPDLAVGDLDLLQHEPDDGRLARAGSADDEDELALLDRERDVSQRRHVGLVDLRHVLEHDHRRARGRGRRRHGLLIENRCGGVGVLEFRFLHENKRATRRGGAPGGLRRRTLAKSPARAPFQGR